MLKAFSSSKAQEIVAGLLLVVAGALFYAATYNRSSYEYILRADEGVSFATAMRTVQGFVPQRDFPSYYGPVMPYVYAAAFKLFGGSLAVMRAFWAFLNVLSVLLLFRIARHLLPTWMAFLAAVLVIGQQHPPLYTYNHIGLVLAIEGILLLMLRAMSKGAPKYFKWALTALLLLALLIKFNEALVVLVVIVVFLWISKLWIRRSGSTGQLPPAIPLRDVVIPGALAIVIFAAITFALNAGLTQAEFMRNFPLLPQYQASIGGYKYVSLVLSIPFRTPWAKMTAHRWYILWYENYVFAMLASFVLGIFFLIAAAQFFFPRTYRRTIDLVRWKSVLVLAVAAATYHEFFLTGNHWSTPMYIGLCLVAIVSFIWHALAGFPRLRYVPLLALLCVCLVSDAFYIDVVHRKYSAFYLDSPRARIYSSDDSDAPLVSEVVEFLEHNSNQQASIAAFPHDALLIYLAGRRNALRDDDYQWMLFPTEQSDDEIVREIETKKVSEVLISNFVGIRHGQPVFFGRDYLPHTFNYLQEHYRLVKTFGDNPRAYQVQYLRLDDAGDAEQSR